MLKTDPDMPDEEVTVDYCLDTMVTAGSPRTVADRLAEFRDETGPFETLVTSHHDWTHRDVWVRHMELMAKEVMPRLRANVGWRAAAD